MPKRNVTSAAGQEAIVARGGAEATVGDRPCSLPSYSAPGAGCAGGSPKRAGGKPALVGATPLVYSAEQCNMWTLGGVAPPPPIGSKNTKGRRSRMEDTDTICRNLIEIPVLFRQDDHVIPKALENEAVALLEGSMPDSPRTTLARFPSEHSDDGIGAARPISICAKKPLQQERVESTFHFAGVFDGHGGQRVSSEVAARLHLLVAEAFIQTMLMSCSMVSEPATDSDSSESFHRSTSPFVGTTSLKRKHRRGVSGDSTGSNASDTLSSPTHKTARMAGEDSTLTGTSLATVMLRTSAQRRPSSHLMMNHPGLTLEQIASALRLAFQWMDDELLKQHDAQNVGSTAVVTMVSSSHICLANCGDSRAVISRSGMACRLTRDHKPEMEDEQDRITNHGGKVLDFNGKRVMGLLAMSRALGDHCLREVGVIAEPEVTIIGRDPKDEFMVLATDGLWDVLSDIEVCDLARRCFLRAKERGAEADTATRVAASVLMRAALDRGSNDNITVTVVDLHPGGI